MKEQPQQLTFEGTGGGGEQGYSSKLAVQIAGISYRQLDYWDHVKLIRPSVVRATGSGSRRLYGYRDLLELKIIKQLLDAGIKLQKIRSMFDYVRHELREDVTASKLLIDGARVMLARSDSELIDLLQRGQGVFNVLPLGNIKREVDAAIIELRPAWEVTEADADGVQAAVGTTDNMNFAHPSEQAFGSLLDSYGIRWEYEPHMFVLQTYPCGNTACGFTPDFYLPDFDIYVELTTLQQRLVSRKKRKVRLLAQTHPHVTVKLLNRSDMEWIGRKYGLGVAA